MPVLAELKAAEVDQHPAQARSMSCCSSIRSAGVTHETANVCAAWDGECLCWRAFQTPAVSHCLVNYTTFLSSWLRSVQCYPHGSDTSQQTDESHAGNLGLAKHCMAGSTEASCQQYAASCTVRWFFLLMRTLNGLVWVRCAANDDTPQLLTLRSVICLPYPSFEAGKKVPLNCNC